MRSLAEARIKRSRAVELLAEGCSYDEIPRQIGFTNRGSAHRAVSKALSEREVEDVDELRASELVRLDRLQSAVWAKAMTGDIRAVNTVVKIIGQRARLLGLGGRAGPEQRGAFPQMLVVGPEGRGWQPVTLFPPHRLSSGH